MEKLDESSIEIKPNEFMCALNTPDEQEVKERESGITRYSPDIHDPDASRNPMPSQAATEDYPGIVDGVKVIGLAKTKNSAVNLRH